MNEDLQEQMREAMRLALTGRVNEATATIQQALSEAAAASAAHGRKSQASGATGVHSPEQAAPALSALILDGCVFEVEEDATAASAILADFSATPTPDLPAGPLQVSQSPTKQEAEPEIPAVLGELGSGDANG